MNYENALNELIKILLKHGVVVNKTEITRICDKFERVDFGTLDFSEHDKAVMSEMHNQLSNMNTQLEKLRQENNELEIELAELREEKQIEHELAKELPIDPIDVASYLINATRTYETSSIQKAIGMGDTDTYNAYDISDLRQIAKHLMIYCEENEE